MLFCNECGQCILLSDESFIEVRNTSGWETVNIDPDDGSIVDYIDSEISDSSHENYECPNCASEDIDDCWDGNEEEALVIRSNHERRMSVRNEERRRHLEEEKKHKKAKDPNREWDVVENV